MSKQLQKDDMNQSAYPCYRLFLDAFEVCDVLERHVKCGALAISEENHAADLVRDLRRQSVIQRRPHVPCREDSRRGVESESRVLGR